jgi:hypothetical protein
VSSDKEKLNQLSTRVDELLVTINKITEELRSISASIKLIAIGQNQQPAITTVTLKTTTSPNPTSLPQSPTLSESTSTVQIETKLRTLDEVRMSFPEDLEAKLEFEDKTDYITVKPKQFLGSDNFAKIASAIRGMGGEYISAGKDSHFRVPKKRTAN